jgi:hypothetical protein
MSVERGLVLGVSGMAALLGACSFLVPFAEYDRETAQAAAPVDAGGAEAGEASTCTDTKSDALNCGECGHDCRGSGCLEGLCERQPIIPAGRSVAKLGVDDTHVYFAYPETGELLRLKKGAPLEQSEPLATGLTGVSSLRLGGTGDDIFWVHPTTKPGANFEIGRTSKTTGSAPERLLLASQPSILSFDETSIYFVDDIANLFVVDRKFATAPRMLASGIFDGFVDGDSIYATVYRTTPLDSSTDHIVRMGKDGTNAVTLATGQAGPSTIHADATFLFWSNTATESQIVRLPKAPAMGAVPEPLYAAAAQLFLIKVLGEHLYFLTVSEQTPAKETVGRVWRISKNGGTALPLTPQLTYTSLGLDATHIYWASGGAIYRSAN